ncbi:hypothetical protein LIER_32416 [Lithospermum erythrorhizon]|uniref:Pentatricopeptide repeat-containing protein n=1 Tax=Lithospermum erythrorhizon TaxID=34254 RepID=A0AAV3RTS1_LITER
MPFKPDAVVWRTLLGACRMCGDIDFANKVAAHLLELEPQEHCTYVLLSDMHGYFKNWKEIARLKILMKESGVKKVPGWSWIEIRTEVHAFNAEDHSHPHCKEIYYLLSQMMDEIKFSENSGDSVTQTAYMEPL